MTPIANSNAAAVAMQSRSAKPSTLRRIEIRWGYLFISPWIIGFLVFTTFPMAASLYLSFTNYSILRNESADWVWFDNYRETLSIQIKPADEGLSRGYSHLASVGDLEIGATDPDFWISLRVTFTFIFISLPTSMALGLALAMLLNNKIRGIRIFRTLIYSPVMMPAIASGVIFQRLLGEKTGWINQAMAQIGIDGPNWLGSPQWALTGLTIISLWGAGASMLIYLSGLQSIPTELYEAAKVDGANALVRFQRITLPMLSPIILYNLVLGLIGLFQYFAIPYALTDGTGRPGQSTYFYNMYLYETAWSYGEMGRGSALAWILFAIVLAITIAVFRTSGRWVFYAGGSQR